MLDECQKDKLDDSIAALIGIIDNTPMAASVMPTLAVPVKEGKATHQRNIA